jgi:hypothetical protein
LPWTNTIGVCCEEEGGISVEQALINSPVKASSQRLPFIKFISGAIQLIEIGFNLKFEKHVARTPMTVSALCL